MTVLKCKMCGGNVIFNEDEKVGVCESCGTKQTIAKESVKKNNKKSADDVLINGEIVKTNIDTFIKRGKIALEDREWVKADSFFEEALNIDAECAYAYIGKFLALSECSDFDEVIEIKKKKIDWYLENISADLIIRAIILSHEEIYKYEKHIEEQISKYCIPGFLTEDDIKKMYSFENINFSEEEEIIYLKKDTINRLKNDKILKRAISYAKDEEKKIIDKFIDGIKKLYDEEYKYEEQKESEVISKHRKQIEDLFKRKDKEIVELYNEKFKQKELDEKEKKKKDTMSFWINSVSWIIIIISVLFLFLCLEIHLSELFHAFLITFPIWFVAYVVVSSEKMPKCILIRMLSIFLLIFAIIKTSMYFEAKKAVKSKEIQGIEIEKIDDELEKGKINFENKNEINYERGSRDAKVIFNEFMKEGTYIPIEEFRTKIAKIVYDSLEIVFVDIENDDTESLMIKPSVSENNMQIELDKYIKKACKNKNIKYAYVNIHESDYIHSVTLVEKKK